MEGRKENLTMEEPEEKTMDAIGDHKMGPHSQRLENVKEYWDYLTTGKISSGMERVLENLKIAPSIAQEGRKLFQIHGKNS